MKVSVLTLFILMTTQFISIGQTASVKFFTNLDEAKFRIYFMEEQQNNLPIKEIEFDSLSHKEKYKVLISFTKDSIADINEEFYLLKDEHKVFEIKKKTTISSKSAKLGRKVGKFLKIGDHSKDDILYDVFYLDDVTKSEYLNN